jgi:uncharacterized sulfatase
MNEDALGTINQDSIFSAIDLVPTLLEICKASPAPNTTFDGEPLANILLGESNSSRQKPIFFRRPPDRNSFYGVNDLPDLAVRNGRWKLLCEYDGSAPLLYDLSIDPKESKNLAKQRPDILKELTKAVVAWHNAMPTDNGPALEYGSD